MSLQRTYRTRISIPRARFVQGKLNVPDSPATDLLRKAMEKAASDNGGGLDSVYHDCLGRTHECWLAVHTPGFNRGVGIRFGADGQVSFSYDAGTKGRDEPEELIGQAPFISDSNEVAVRLCGEIAQHYAVLALVSVLQSLGCVVRIRPMGDTDRQVLVSGEDASGRLRNAQVDHHGRICLDMVGYSGEDCVPAESGMRRGLDELGLHLEVATHRRKEGDDPSQLSHRPGASSGGH